MAQLNTGCVYELRVDHALFFIGIASDIDKCMAEHRANINTSNHSVYRAIRDNDGKYEMSVLMEFNYTDEAELRIAEFKAYYILKPTLNMCSPYVSSEEATQYLFK